MDARMDLLIGDLSKTLQWTSPPPNLTRDKVALLTQLSSSLLTEYMQVLSEKSQIARECDHLKRQMTLLNSQTHQISFEIEKKLKVWRFHTIACDECKATIPTSDDFERPFKTDKEGSIDTITEVEDENDPEQQAETEPMETGFESVTIPGDVLRIQKRLFANIEELNKLILNSGQDLSLGQQIREISLENQSLRARNSDLSRELDTFLSSHSCLPTHSPTKSSPRTQSFKNRAKQTWSKSKLTESKCLCGLLHAIVTTLYNMIREKDQIEVALEQFSAGSETVEIPFGGLLGLAEQSETAIKRTSVSERKRLRKSDFALSKDNQPTDEPEALRDKLEKQSTKIAKLKTRLDNLRKAVAKACKRIEQVQRIRGSPPQNSFWAVDTSPEVLIQTPGMGFSLIQRVVERLVPLTDGKDDDWDVENVECRLKQGVKELKTVLKSAKQGWKDYLPSDFLLENDENELLFSDLQTFLRQTIEILPLIAKSFDCARHCFYLSQTISRNPSETPPEKINFRTFPILLAHIEHNLIQIPTEKSSFRTPPSKNVRTRSRFSFSSNEKLLKDELGSIEKAKNEVQIQELLFENEQLKDSQCSDTIKLNEFVLKMSELESENKVLREKIDNLEAAIELLQEKLTKIKSMEESSGRTQQRVDFSSAEVHCKLDELDQSIKDLLQTMQNEKREILFPRLRKIITKSLEFGLETFFSRWKAATFTTTLSETWDHDPLRLWKLSILRKNQLLECASSAELSVRTPMPPIIVLKTVDEIMLKRGESISPESFPTFAIECMTQKLGCRNAAIRVLKQAIATLVLFTEEEFYGQFLARVMQVQNPLSDEVTEFFISVNCQAYTLVRKRSEEKMDERERLGIDIDFIDPESGGKLFLSDALDLVYSLELAKDSNLCRKVINYLRASDMDKRDYVLFVISHKMQREYFDPSDFFDGHASMPLPTFIPTLKSRLSLCVSEKKLLAVFQPFQVKGKITLADVKKAVSLQFYGLNATNDYYTIDRFYLLYVLSFVYDYCVDRSIEILQSLYEANSLEEDAENCFWMSLFSVDQTMGEVRCRELTSEALSLFATEQLTESHFINFVAEKQLGGYFVRPFRVERKEAVNMRRRARNEIMSQGAMQGGVSPGRREQRRTIVGVNLRSERKS